jgi:hypothetical protein
VHQVVERAANVRECKRITKRFSTLSGHALADEKRIRELAKEEL